MQYNPNIHRRRAMRLKEYDYSQSGAYFVTICAHDRECLLGNIVGGEMQMNQYGDIVRREWIKTGEIRKNIELDEFIVMPNHIHGIVIITAVVGATRRVAPTYPNGPKPGSMGAIFGQFKCVVTKRINALRQTPGRSVWQRNYYEHIIRNENELIRIREYIHNNPLNWEHDNYHMAPPEKPKRMIGFNVDKQGRVE